MRDAMQLLREAVHPAPAQRRRYRWEEIAAAMDEVIGKGLTPDVEHLLVSILRSDRPVETLPSPDGPHSMPPADMLKSLAVQALADWTGATYAREFRQLQAKRISPALASVVGAVRTRLAAAAPLKLEFINLPRPRREQRAVEEAITPGKATPGK
jgi:hypothetical protein